MVSSFSAALAIVRTAAMDLASPFTDDDDDGENKIVRAVMAVFQAMSRDLCPPT